MNEPTSIPEPPDDEQTVPEDEPPLPPDPYAEEAARDQLLGPDDDPD